MILVPDYCISYHGEFYEKGEQVKILQQDSERMKKFGTVLDDADEAPKEPQRRARRTTRQKSE